MRIFVSCFLTLIDTNPLRNPLRTDEAASYCMCVAKQRFLALTLAQHRLLKPCRAQVSTRINVIYPPSPPDILIYHLDHKYGLEVNGATAVARNLKADHIVRLKCISTVSLKGELLIPWKRELHCVSGNVFWVQALA